MWRILKIIKGEMPIHKLCGWICGNCRTMILRTDKYCHCCGSKIRWDKVE